MRCVKNFLFHVRKLSLVQVDRQPRDKDRKQREQCNTKNDPGCFLDALRDFALDQFDLLRHVIDIKARGPASSPIYPTQSHS